MLSSESCFAVPHIILYIYESKDNIMFLQKNARHQGH